MGKVFVQTNEADNNRVIVFEGDDDGALTQLESVATGGKGDGVPNSPRRARFYSRRMAVGCLWPTQAAET